MGIALCAMLFAMYQSRTVDSVLIRLPDGAEVCFSTLRLHASLRNDKSKEQGSKSSDSA